MGAVPPDKFGALIAKYAATVKRDIRQTVRAVAFEWFSGVIKRTPLDSGRMRGNWITSACAPSYSIIDRADESAAITEAKNNIDPYGVTYMTNNLPYAERREKEGGEPVKGIKRKPFQYGQGRGGGFIEEELKRVTQNMERIVKHGS
jgi:hypothetical protein